MREIPFSESDVTKPVYLWFEKYIKKLIADDYFQPGEKILSEREFSQLTGISRLTIRRAIEALIKQEILERRSSSGTFVVKKPFFGRAFGPGAPAEVGFSQKIREMGRLPGSKLLKFSVHEGDEKICEKLNLNPGDPVLEIQRLRTISDIPVCIETNYIPAQKVPDLYYEELLQSNASLYELLEKKYGIRMGSTGYEILQISYATQSEAKALHIQTMDPVLLFRCIILDQSGCPFEYLVSVNHPDYIVFESSGNTNSLLNLRSYDGSRH